MLTSRRCALEIDQLKSHNADAAARATDGELQGEAGLRATTTQTSD